MLRFWGNKIPTLNISRSRPYHKNDNRFVEENNSGLVRAYIGHGRLDTLPQLQILRDIYKDLMCYHNFFQPVMKTIRKDYMDEFHYRRVFDQAQPPLDRLAQSGVLANVHLERLFHLRDQIDVILLRERLESNIDQLWRIGKPNNPISVNIFDILRKEEDKALVTLSFEPKETVQ